MGGNGSRDGQAFRGIQTKALRDPKRYLSATIALCADDLQARRFSEMEARLKRVDRETDRPEAPAEVTIEVEETQM